MPKFCVAIEIVSKKLDSCLVLFHLKNGNAEANKNNNSLETTTQNLTSQQYSSTAVSHFTRCTLIYAAQNHSCVWTCPTGAMDSLAQIICQEDDCPEYPL